MMMKSWVSSVVPVWALLMVPMTTEAAEGDECSSDADCETGAICEKASWVDGCSPVADDGSSADGDDGGSPAPLPPECDTTVHEAEFGRCVVPPQACSEDADCGEYEHCYKVTNGGTDCVASEDSDSSSDACDAPPPSESEAGLCGPVSAQCESTDECPREFECVATGGGDSGDGCACVTTPCDCEVDLPETKSCLPKAIECDESSECPSDWTCQGTERKECSGGGSSGEPSDDGADSAVDGTPPPTREDGSGDSGSGTPEPDQPEECVVVRQKGACVPPGWGYDSASGSVDAPRGDGDVNSGGDDIGSSDGAEPGSGHEGDDSVPPVKDGDTTGEGATGDGAGEAAGNTSAQGGCSVGPKMRTPTPGGWVIGIAMLSVLARRRRRAA